MGKRVALYLRVSTSGQTVENQRRELLSWAERCGHDVVAEFCDAGISGSKGRDKRPQFDEMLKAATRRQFDMIASWSVDRLGRSLQDLVGFLSEIHSAGVDLFLHQQALDTTTPSGKAMFGMLGIFGEFEAAMIRERVNAGLARAKAEGKQLGRPKAKTQTEEKIRELRAEGKGILRIAREVGCGVSVVQRVVAAQATATA